jgi:CRISPR-associated endonuclease/helicase Cas3
MYFAHSIEGGAKDTWQRLDDHLNGVGILAAGFAAKFRAQKAGAFAGRLHDLGKYTAKFQARLDGAAVKVDHATAGAKLVFDLAARGEDKVTAALIAYAIAGHHTGLPDMRNDGGSNSLEDRLKSPLEELAQAWKTEIAVDAARLWPGWRPEKDKQTAAFQTAFLGRMLFSCLIDADRLDTEAFMAKAEGWKPDREWPPLGELIDGFLHIFNAHMEHKQANADGTPVNRLRSEILGHVRARAGETPGLFTLTVPTGGGKTLASLAFALDHAKAHGLDRIIYAIPFTSVVDQTADVFRNILGGDYILEHHSAIDEDKARERGSADKLKLAMENWAAPLVITTNVQLFESLFAARPSRCRKLHNLARSVIILDEAQTIPLPFLRPCVAAIHELTRNYGTSAVLCTATQPALDARHFQPGGLPLEGRELAWEPEPGHLARALKRVTIRFSGEMDDDALADALAVDSQGLVIVNSRAHALALYRKVKAAGLDGVIHLTTRQYAAHRRVILADVRQRLKAGEPCRLIATSLVEAGVDLDFPRLWRAEAGLDQIAQAAGRCNREGGRAAEASIVTIFKAPEYKPPREIAQLAADFARMAGKHEDLLSPAALEEYFREVYWRKGDALDRERIIQDFAMSSSAKGIETSFAYRTVAGKFQMIESGMVPVIIAREEPARKALDRLAVKGVSPGGVARDLQSYLVQIPPKARMRLWQYEHIYFASEENYGDQFAVLKTAERYSDEEGLVWDDPEYLISENLHF